MGSGRSSRTGSHPGAKDSCSSVNRRDELVAELTGRDTDEIRTHLWTRDGERRQAAMIALQAVGTDRARRAQAINLQQQIEAYRKKKLGHRVKVSAVIGGVPAAAMTLAHVLLRVLKEAKKDPDGGKQVWEGLGFVVAVTIAVAIVGAVAFALYDYRVQRRRDPAHTTPVFDDLAQACATDVIDEISLCLLDKDPNVRAGAMHTLATLLPASAGRGIAPLKAPSLHAVCTSVIQESPRDMPAHYRATALNVLAATGDTTDLARIDRWLQKKRATVTDSELLSIEAWRRRLKQAQGPDTLLRAAVLTQTEPLLRPAQQDGNADPELLLRASADGRDTA